MAKVVIDDKKCKGCGLCIDVCPKKILAFDKSRLNEIGYHPIMVTNMEECIGCAMCARMCPDVILEIFK
ncbi:MAG: 4Fe-4S binding protein [Eubacteriales bacterium]